jgi:hypothetical protein
MNQESVNEAQAQAQIEQDQRCGVLKMYLFENKYVWESKPTYMLFSTRIACDNWPEATFIREMDVPYEIPASFNRTASKIASLQNVKEKLTNDFGEKLAEIDKKLAELQCIEYTYQELTESF